jgi:hypothetical protein
MLRKQKFYNKVQPYALALCATFFLWACTYHNEEELYGDLAGNCNTSAVSYATDVLPLLQSNCYVCHSQAASQGGINLESYSRVKAFAENGRLLGSVSHAAGFSPMPKNGAKLPLCEINKIRSWIDAGMPEN